MADSLLSNEQLQVLTDKLKLLFDKLPLDKVRLGICVLAGIWLISSLVNLIWLLVPVPEVQPIALGPQATDRTQSSTGDAAGLNLAALQATSLFGEADAKAVQQAAEVVQVQPTDNISGDVATTRLQLVLTGLIAASDQRNSLAIIEYQRNQMPYKVGDKLPGSQRVTLAKVLYDRVILDNGGRYEKLMLYDDERQSVAQSYPRAVNQVPSGVDADAQVQDRRQDSDITSLVSGYRRQLLSNPTSLAEVIKVSVSKAPDGSIEGYRIRPGRDREQFMQLGLQPNDIVTDINGIELNNPTKALEVYRLLREAKEATFGIKRGGQQLSIIVALQE